MHTVWSCDIIYLHTTPGLDKERRSLWPEMNVLYAEKILYNLYKEIAMNTIIVKPGQR